MIMLGLIGLLVTSLVMTGLLRQYALSKQLMDIPNHRSSHTNPTPRGGGASFVICFLSFIPVLQYFTVITFSLGIVLFSGTTIAILGYLDDRYQLSALWRLFAHFIISVLVMYFIDGAPSIVLFFWTIPSSMLLSVFGIIYLVWLLNLYNFMDGIDGIAGIEAVTVCFGVALVYWLAGYGSQMYLPLSLAFPVLGFLFWNFPAAKIFMGDVGSGFLGFMMGVMSLNAAQIDGNLLWSWLVLLGVFIIDATLTLLRRIISAKKISEAHCEHAYQNAAKHFESHSTVSLMVGFMNIIWLLPWAILIALDYIDGAIGLLFSYTPLLLLAIKFNAGKKYN